MRLWSHTKNITLLCKQTQKHKPRGTIHPFVKRYRGPYNVNALPNTASLCSGTGARHCGLSCSDWIDMQDCLPADHVKFSYAVLTVLFCICIFAQWSEHRPHASASVLWELRAYARDLHVRRVLTRRCMHCAVTVDFALRWKPRRYIGKPVPIVRGRRWQLLSTGTATDCETVLRQPF